MTSEGLGEMFEGDSADTFAGKFPLVSMGGRAEGLACADPGARTPYGASGNFYSSSSLVGTVIQNPRKGCRRVSNCCMGSSVTKRLGFQWRKKNWGPPLHPPNIAC